MIKSGLCFRVRVPVMSFLDHFSNLSDPRSHINRRHDLLDIVFLTVSAVLSGAEGWVDIGVVAQINEQVMTSPAPGDRYTWGFLTGRPRIFSLFMALTYAMTSPTWPL